MTKLGWPQNKVCRVITACAMLHNLAKVLNIPDEDDDEADNIAGNINNNAQVIPANNADGQAARDRIVTNFF